MQVRDASDRPAEVERPTFDRWVRLMRKGAWEDAWRQRDRSLLDIGPDEYRRPRHLQRLWRGQSLSGQRVLIVCQHGLGDTLQFVRYVPLVAERARHVTLAVQPALIPLVEDLPGLDRVVPLFDGPPDADVDHDVMVEVMELPHVFRTTPDTVPASIPYLRVPTLVPATPTVRPRVGFAWRAGDWDAARSLSPADARALVRSVPWHVVPLLPDPRPQEEELFAGSPGPASMPSLAATVMSVDLVVSVDSVFAHLAGALGVTVWILLKTDPDWRWMERRDTSPWYPTARLFRQPKPGDWGSVVSQVRELLATRRVAARLGSGPNHAT